MSNNRKAIALARIHGILELMVDLGEADLEAVKEAYRIADEQLELDDQEAA